MLTLVSFFLKKAKGGACVAPTLMIFLPYIIKPENFFVTDYGGKYYRMSKWKIWDQSVGLSKHLFYEIESPVY
jgi:hypothetical protein